MAVLDGQIDLALVDTVKNYPGLTIQPFEDMVKGMVRPHPPASLDLDLDLDLDLALDLALPWPRP